MKHHMKDDNEILRFIKVRALMVAVVGIVALLVATPSLVSANELPSSLVGTALLRQVGGSGVSGQVTITENGSGVIVSGNAVNLQAGDFSLFYDILSVATGRACVPGRVDDVGLSDAEFRGQSAIRVHRADPAFLTDDQMGEGGQLLWVDDNSAYFIIDPTNNTVAVGLDKIRTISIRRPGTPRSTLLACGLIVVEIVGSDG